MSPRDPWPVLTRYAGDHLACVALPLGGIGTGTISLGGRGDLRDFEVVNKPAKGFVPRQTFFALFAQPEGDVAVTRALEGMLQPPYEGAFGARAANHGLPRFRHCAFAAAYPFGQVELSDPEVPLTVTLEAFNPLIPGDSERSGLPLAVLRYRLHNPTDRSVTAAVCGTTSNFIGGSDAAGNRNHYRQQEGLAGLAMTADLLAPDHPEYGSFVLCTPDEGEITCRTAWAALSWGDSLLDFWDDFSADGRLEERAGTARDPQGSLAVRTVVPPHGERAITFILSWHFPNRTTWTPADPAAPAVVGNWYTTRYEDAWHAAAAALPELPTLERDTLAFVNSLVGCDLPAAVKEAALYNLSTLRSTTCFRTADGRFYGWEGCGDTQGCCHGSCTHVWNYEQATPFLFGDLARSMREVEFAQATGADGHMSFRVNLPLAEARGHGLAAADGQMGCLLKLYREWQLSGDEELLRSLWPQARAALEFCWQPGGWDADRDGVMEGCQHNTMDVEYYGPNPQMGGWYLGALRAAEEMARYLGQADFADDCHDLYLRGRAWLDEHLFNGEYYEHEIRPPADAAAIAPGLRHESMGARDLSDPELQLGAGCLVDQLVGQFMAHVCGLGYLLDPEHVAETHRSIYRHNFRPSLHGHFNHLRTFALADEAALLMATYPRGRRPQRPFPYYNEVMTGFEYTAAVGMLYEGQTEAGLRCIEAVRARYDGRRRNPFNEAECGNHYARAMASWAAILALTGFQYSAVTGTMRLAAAAGPATWFWSTGQAWGTVQQAPADETVALELRVLGGRLTLRRVELRGRGAVEVEPTARLAGETLHLTVLGAADAA